MKNLIIIFLFFIPNLILSQNNFTHDYLVNDIVKDGRWESDIKIYIYGNCSEENKNTIKETITYFNSLLETIEISIVNNKDFYLYHHYYLCILCHQNLHNPKTISLMT